MKPCQTPARGRSVFVLLACALSWLCTVAALAAGEGQDAALAVPAARHLLAKRASSDGASSARTRRNRARASQTNAAVRQWSDWRSRLFANVMTAYKRLELERKALVEPAGHRAFDLFSPFMDCPGGRPPVLIGGIGDGAKFACMEQLLEPDCVVYSLGSNGNFAFEDDVLARTHCRVVTFDCTSPPRANTTRHAFVHKCLGSATKMATNPASWITIGAAQAQLDHSRVTYMKMDIEAAEYDVLATWSIGDAGLPDQLAMEVHSSGIYSGTPAYLNSADDSSLLWPLHDMRLADLALFVGHVASLGYGIASREDNPLCLHCTELLFVKVAV